MASTVRMDVKEVLRHFKELEDPRSSVNLLHPLDSVVVIAIMAVLAGANGPTAIAKWANIKAEVLLKLLDLPGVAEANVDIVWDPPWTPQMISPAARERLGMA